MRSVNNSESNNFKFGKQIIKNDTALTISKNKILFSRVDKDKFSYTRNDPENKITKNLIQYRGNLEIEIAPVLPIHLPAYKTDFVFIRFTDPIFISGKSTTELTVPFPIEIGIFLISDGQTDMLDCFSSEPGNSRFGLYGTPEEGKLCKYVKTPLFFDKNIPSPSAYTNLRITVENELEESAHVGKIIVPASDHDLYYNNENAMMDELKIEIKNRGGLKIIEVVQKPIVKPDNWSLSPRNIKKTDYKFSMEWGFR